MPPPPCAPLVWSGHPSIRREEDASARIPVLAALVAYRRYSSRLLGISTPSRPLHAPACRPATLSRRPWPLWACASSRQSPQPDIWLCPRPELGKHHAGRFRSLSLSVHVTAHTLLSTIMDTSTATLLAHHSHHHHHHHRTNFTTPSCPASRRSYRPPPHHSHEAVRPRCAHAAATIMPALFRSFLSGRSLCFPY